jgi:hypothetical protein
MIIEFINTVFSGIESAQEMFPIGVPVEVISGQVCTATEYRPSKRHHPVSKNHSPPVEVWGHITGTIKDTP